MIGVAVGFFTLAFFAMILGATEAVGISMDLGQTLIGGFLILAVLSFIAGMTEGEATNLL